MQKYIKFVQENLVFSNLFVGFCVLSLYKVTEILFRIPSNQEMSIFILFSAVAAYNFSRIPILFSNNIHFSHARQWVWSNKYLFISIIFLSSIVSIYYIILLRLIYFSIPLVFISLFYVFSPIKFLKIIFPNITVSKTHTLYRTSLREIPLVKIFLISSSWTYLTVVIPAITNNMAFDIYIISIVLIHFLFIFAITIPFDIRDIKFDKIITLPSFFGINNSKIIAYISLFFCELIILLLYLYNYLFFSVFIALLITFEIASLFVFFTKKDNKELFFSFYIEGLSILMFLGVYIASNFI
tara:strand:- start:880 stop:1773 length:894 start_codon:yes stop_codon:yes gene_type:complete